MLKTVLIVLGSLVVLVVIFGFVMFFGLTGGSSNVKMIRATYGKGGKKVLVAYASKAGSTAEAADIMGKALGEAGYTADVVNVKDVKDISGYDAFLLGTSIRAGKVASEYDKFITANAETLKSKPTGIFLLCMTLSKDTPENRKMVAEYFAPIRQKITPVSEGLFAGRMDYSKLNPVARYAVTKMVKTPEGDFMKPEEIKKWARETVKKI